MILIHVQFQTKIHRCFDQEDFRWVLQAKILEANYEAKLDFPGGRGCKTKNLSWGEYWLFFGTAQFINLELIRRKYLCKYIQIQ